MRTILSVAILISLFFQACQSPVDHRERLVSKLDSLMATVPDFSGVVLVAEKGRTHYHKAFGYSNFETKVPLDTASIFELASVSKQFTAMIVMMLQEAGALQYDDPLEKYVPGLPYPGITLRHLLTHTSSLPDYQQLMDDHWNKDSIAGNPDIIRYLKKFHPERNFSPGERYEYSNTGYMLLGSVAEVASGKDFIQLCREQIFIPLRMSSTDIRSLQEKAAIENFALGHQYVPEKKRYVRADSFPSSNYTIWLGNRKGPGRISSTTSDLLAWDRALYTTTLVKKETLDKAFTPAQLNNGTLTDYGFGWTIRTHPTLGNVVWHNGDNPGYKTIIVRYIDINKTVIVLCNNAHETFKATVDAIENLLAAEK
ncbi:MAG: beta-lactamase family protein [Cyclobacteriaceae bacterium]|nr:beta-lactamase family protein [Cyclobacteriaceae bacterium]